jgi:hypothetical protein
MGEIEGELRRDPVDSAPSDAGREDDSDSSRAAVRITLKGFYTIARVVRSESRE